MAYFPMASAVPLGVWQALACAALVVHLIYIPAVIAVGRFEKVLFLAYPVIAFVGVGVLALQFDMDSKEAVWSAYAWALAGPTLLTLGHGHRLDEARRAAEKHGGNQDDHLTPRERRNLGARAIGVIVLLAWIVLTQ